MTRPSWYDQFAESEDERNERLRAKRLYRMRAKNQALAWANGRSYHEPINDECCPDFSCCHPDLFEKDASKRWQYYRKNFGDFS